MLLNVIIYIFTFYFLTVKTFQINKQEVLDNVGDFFYIYKNIVLWTRTFIASNILV